MIDNSVMRSLWAISEISTDEIGVTHILRDFRLSDMSDRLSDMRLQKMLPFGKKNRSLWQSIATEPLKLQQN